MRYFRYHNSDKNFSNALKEQYKTLNENEKQIRRKEFGWRRFCIAVTLLVFIVLTAGGVYLINAIPQPDSLLLKILVGIMKGAAGLIVGVAAGIMTYGVTVPLWKKAGSFHLPAMKKEILSKACGHLRSFYGLQEPCIVTKCFDASDRKFRNHDVCLFVAGGELRITTDLIRGFLHGERDLGCWAFRKDEIILSKRQRGNQLVAELGADQTTFVLGYRAKGFIEKNFIGME